ALAPLLAPTLGGVAVSIHGKLAVAAIAVLATGLLMWRIELGATRHATTAEPARTTSAAPKAAAAPDPLAVVAAADREPATASPAHDAQNGPARVDATINSATIHGVVADAADHPVAGATVFLGRDSDRAFNAMTYFFDSLATLLDAPEIDGEHHRFRTTTDAV